MNLPYRTPIVGFINAIYRLAEDIAVETLLTKTVYLPVSYPNPFFLRHLPNGKFIGLGIYIQGEPSQNDVRHWAVIDISSDATTQMWAEMAFKHGETIHRVEFSEPLSERIGLLYDCLKYNASAPSVTCENLAQMCSAPAPIER